MDETREDRMRSRMRGAARHQVQNADFGDLFAIPFAPPEPEPEPEPESSSVPPAAPSVEPQPEAQPAIEPEPEPATEAEPTPRPLESVKRTSPNTSAKRRRLDSAGRSAPSPAQSSAPANRSSRRLPPAAAVPDPYDVQNAPFVADQTAPAPASAPRGRPSGRRSVAGRTSAAVSSARRSPEPAEPLSQSPPRAEEVGESPADAPGSGHRRRVRDSSAVVSSARLQSALRSADGDTSPIVPQSSSPLSRKSIKSAAKGLASARSARTNLRRSTRLSGSPDQEINELSSDLPVVAEDESSAVGVVSIEDQEQSLPEVAETVIEEPTGEVVEDEEAQEIGVREAAQRLGRRRAPKRAAETSPELSPEDDFEEPVARPPRKAAPLKKTTLAKQKQPKPPRIKQKKPPSERKKKKNDDQAGAPIPVKVQRFTKVRRRRDNESDDEDILNSDIPHTSRSGVNAVDFLGHTCERVIGSSTNKLQEALQNSQDPEEKKILKVKLKALDAFQQEQETRLLEHTIAIDTLFALKKRVREAQREKLKLRERIIEIRAERQQVALRMDAVRVKHEEDSKKALHDINLSSAMHDVDLAIEQGLAGPELSAKEQKTADLANLELLISRVTEQACSSGPGGGALKQIRSFNAFLERAVAAL